MLGLTQADISGYKTVERAEESNRRSAEKLTMKSILKNKKAHNIPPLAFGSRVQKP